MDVDLNEEALDGSVVEIESLLNELESTHGQIEERIRQLEAVSLRARNRQRWRQEHTQNVVVGARERISNSELIAKALEMVGESKKVESCGGFYDCNICLERAKEPILTCCGHLFCWPCFYGMSHSASYVKECPVCKGEVKDTSIVPIYGNGSDERSESCDMLKVPARPRAPRVEGVRQQLFSRRIEVMGEDGSAMEPAERLVENLEAYIHSRRLRRRSDQEEMSDVAENTSYRLPRRRRLR